MASPPVALWWLVGVVAVSYAVVPMFLRELHAQFPKEFEEIGSPKFSNIFSRRVSDWRIQRRFFCFLITGQAVKVGRGRLRLLATLTTIAYCGMLVSLVCTVYEAIRNG